MKAGDKMKKVLLVVALLLSMWLVQGCQNYEGTQRMEYYPFIDGQPVTVLGVSEAQ